MGHELVSRPTRLLAASLLGLGLTAAPVAATLASDVSVGAGMRASFKVFDPDSGSTVSTSSVDDVRLYVSGKVTDDISFMFNTDYDNTVGSVDVIDAAAQFKISDEFNVWAGRFLAPSDRANLYGGYYANNWNFPTAVQDMYPFKTAGRDDGVMYWGQFGIAKIAAGLFANTFGPGEYKYAARAQFDFWDPEGGYYQNGTYYGAKDLLAFSLATQGASGNNDFTADFLLEKKMSGGGVVSLEAEAGKFDSYGFDGKGYYALAAYLFPTVVGIGKFQVLAKYGQVKPDGSSKSNSTEFNLNYIIKDQNARLSLFYLDPDSSFKYYGLGLQVQM